MKIYLDDLREVPDKSWTLVRTPQEAFKLIMSGQVELASLDHDLGSGQPTGYDVLKWIEEEVFNNNFVPPAFQIHTANPVGRRNMYAVIKKIKEQASLNQWMEEMNDCGLDGYCSEDFDQYGDN